MIFNYFPFEKSINLNGEKNGRFIVPLLGDHYLRGCVMISVWVVPSVCFYLLPSHTVVCVFVNHAENKAPFYAQL